MNPIPSRILAIPFGVVTALGAYWAFGDYGSGSVFILIGILALIAIYVYSPAINWWWWKRYPPKLDADMERLIASKIKFYQNLSKEDKKKFCARVFFFEYAHNFMPKGIEKTPDDVKMMIAVAPVAMTFQKEEYLFPAFENIVIYPHPFPSPQYETEFHASEIYEEDGVLMFCFTHVVRGFMEPRLYFNPAWYEYAKIYLMTYTDVRLAEMEAVTWEDIEAISNFSKEAIQKWIGLENIDKSAITLTSYFLFPEKFKTVLPDCHQALEDVFK